MILCVHGLRIIIKKQDLFKQVISYGKQSIDQSDIDAVVQVLKGEWLTQGPAVENFENDLKNYFGAKHCCAVSNGTAALHLTGLALSWHPGDVIITTPITFLATANCIVYSGGIPDFVDIDPVSYTIDPNQVEDKIKSYKSKGGAVKAVIGVDFAGHPCDWEALRQIADRYDLQIVNDNCHALGASYLGDKHYAVKYADVVTQSYHPVKNITTGEGGSVLTNDSTIDERVRRLRTHGMTKNQNQLQKNDGPWYYEMTELGYNYRVTDIQCALGLSQLKKLDRFIHKRRTIARKYDKSFSLIEFLKIPQTNDSFEHAYHLYPLQINFEKLTVSKVELFKIMRASGVNLQVHYIPIHLQQFYKKNYGFKTGDFHFAEQFYANVVSIPLYPSLTDDEVGKVVEEIKNFVQSS
jgi:perosamine synthetase